MRDGISQSLGISEYLKMPGSTTEECRFMGKKLRESCLLAPFAANPIKIQNPVILQLRDSRNHIRLFIGLEKVLPNSSTEVFSLWNCTSRQKSLSWRIREYWFSANPDSQKDLWESRFLSPWAEELRESRFLWDWPQRGCIFKQFLTYTSQ